MRETTRIQLQFQDAFASPDEKPLFLTQQGIKGSLKVSGLSSQSTVVKFTFSGYLKNCIGFESTRYMVPPNLSFARDIYECSIVHELDSSSATCNIPFHFPFDRRFLRCEELFEKGDIFPPSLEVDSLKVGKRGGYSKVNYMIKATIVPEIGKAISTKREIRVIDETIPQTPPMWLEGFGKEYVCHQQRILKGKLGLPQGRLSLTASEPSPMEIQGSKSHTMVEIPLKFLYEASPVTGTIIKSWSAVVGWSLKAATFVSTVATRAIPTMDQAHKSPFMRVVEDSVTSGHQKMALTFRREEDANSSTGPTWTSETLLCLDLLRQQLPPPTLWSRYLSRRYIISLQIKPSGEGTGVFELIVPIQIMYSGQIITASPIRDRGSIDTMLPQYVR